VHPARKADGLAYVLFAKLAASVGAIVVHGLGMASAEARRGFARCAEQRMGERPLSRRGATFVTPWNDDLAIPVSPLDANHLGETPC
jgi:hypothetical protein